MRKNTVALCAVLLLVVVLSNIINSANAKLIVSVTVLGGQTASEPTSLSVINKFIGEYKNQTRKTLGRVKIVGASLGVSNQSNSQNSASSSPLKGTYTSCKLLSEAIDYRLHWRIDDSTGEIYVAQEATLPSGRGWLAVGISPNGRMNGGGTTRFADIVHGYAGSTQMSDLNTNVYSKPVPDTQNVVMLNNAQVGNKVVLEWKRKLVTTDPLDHPITPSTQQLLIWAVNDGIMPTEVNNFALHTLKEENGGVPVTFGNTYTCPGQLAGDADMVVELDMRQIQFDASKFTSSLASALKVPAPRIVIKSLVEHEEPFCPECEIVDLRFNYTVPAQVTTYAYRGFALPPGPPKHIVRFEAIKDNPLVLHHIMLMQDVTQVGHLIHYVFDQPISSLPIYAWAPGSDRFDMPPNVGFMLRSGFTDSRLIVNIHYNNPTRIRGLRDTSGIRLYLNTTRQHSAGFLWLGSSIFFPPSINPISLPNMLPSGYPSLHYSVICPDAATAILGNQNLTVFAVMNHMHLYGREIWTDWFRTKGLLQRQYVGKIGMELNYRYDDQKFVAIDPPLKVKAGDSFITHCVYDTRKAKGFVFGGEATENEMCMQGIMYYPNYVVPICGLEMYAHGNCPSPCPKSTQGLFSGSIPLISPPLKVPFENPAPEPQNTADDLFEVNAPPEGTTNVQAPSQATPVSAAPSETNLGETSGTSETAPVSSETAPVSSGSTPSASETAPVSSGSTPSASETTPSVSETAPVSSGSTPSASETTPGAGTNPGASGTVPSASGTTPGASGTNPGASGNIPGVSGNNLVGGPGNNLVGGQGNNLVGLSSASKQNPASSSEPPAFPWWGWVLVAAGVLAVGCIVLALIVNGMKAGTMEAV